MKGEKQRNRHETESADIELSTGFPYPRSPQATAVPADFSGGNVLS